MSGKRLSVNDKIKKSRICVKHLSTAARHKPRISVSFMCVKLFTVN